MEALRTQKVSSATHYEKYVSHTENVEKFLTKILCGTHMTVFTAHINTYNIIISLLIPSSNHTLLI